MTEVDTTTPAIEKTVRIAAPPEVVWSLWTEPEGLRKWWATDAEVVAEPGGRYRIVIQKGRQHGCCLSQDPGFPGRFLRKSP